MAADSKHAEALARLEHKVDVLMSMVIFLVRTVDPTALSSGNQIAEAQVGNINHKCPLCSKQVEYFVDPIDSVVVRKCDCKTGKLAPVDLGAFAPTALPGTRKEEENGNEEDRSDPNSRRRFGRR